MITWEAALAKALSVFDGPHCAGSANSKITASIDPEEAKLFYALKRTAEQPGRLDERALAEAERKLAAHEISRTPVLGTLLELLPGGIRDTLMSRIGSLVSERPYAETADFQYPTTGSSPTTPGIPQ